MGRYNKKTRDVLFPITGRQECSDTHSIWLSRPFPAIEIVLLTGSPCKTPAEKFLDSSNQFKQSRILGQSALRGRAFCSTKNAFLLYISARVKRRNTLLNDSDDRCFVSQTCFHCQFYCVSLCVQLVTYYAKQKKPLECEFWHILPAYFTTLMNSKNFKNDIFGFHAI